MGKSKSLLAPIIIILLLLMGGYAVFQGSKKHQAKTTTDSFINTELLNDGGIQYQRITEQQAEPYLGLVKRFQSLQKEQRASEVLSLFTQPQTEQETDMLHWVDGSDAKLSKPRLYGTTTLWYFLNWYMVKSITQINPEQVNIEVVESRTYRANTGKPDDIGPYYTYQNAFVFEIQPDQKIQAYYYKDGKTDSIAKKYNGFENLP